MIQLCVEHLTITEQKHDRRAQQGTTACYNTTDKQNMVGGFALSINMQKGINKSSDRKRR